MTKWGIRVFGLWAIGLILLIAPVRASHVIGGNIELTPKPGSNGIYSVCVVLYYDANSVDPNADQSEITVSFFRKRDNVRLNDLRLKRVSKQPLPFSNPGCAAARNLEINVVRFCADIQLSPGQYNDQGGYYVSWERCCRTADIGNLTNPGTSSLVLYAEFPPVSTENRSPVFQAANGEILCRDTPYTFASGATDPDGDELRYRLETPFTSTRQPVGIDPLAPSTPGPYPKNEWAAGYGPTNPLPSNPVFRLDPRTGSISLKPSEVGLFAYRIVVEEYRRGRKIGEVHRDYQLLVVDCSTDNPPPVAIANANFPPGATIAEGDTLIEVGMCRGDTLSLSAEANAQFAYQWQRNGTNIAGANGPAILISQEGVYNVVKTYADRCGNARTLGEKFGVKYRSQDKVEITPGPQASVCEGTPLELSVNVGGTGWTFAWQKDGQVLSGASLGRLTGVREAGVYVIRAANAVTRCVSTDTVRVSLNERPPAKITVSDKTFCTGDSLLLEANSGTNYRYVWFKDNIPLPRPFGAINSIKTAGAYAVSVTDTLTGCVLRSDTVRITAKERPEVVFDSIPLLCGQADARLSLVASPAGGAFSGEGVDGTTFDARKAGLGSREILYTYVAPNGCRALARRTATVTPSPRAFVSGRKVILAGDSVLLKTSVTDGAVYTWSPPEGLSDPTVAQPVASPEQTTTYRLRVTSAGGCFSESEIVVEVLPPVKIPNGFTPNGDGANDTWEIENSAAYPDAEVTIFNRWGDKVFAAKGYDPAWDGRFNNAVLPAATYYYVIKLHPDLPVRSGSVTIFK